MTSPAPRYHDYRFPSEIISHAVWLYHRFGLSFRDVEDLLAERGITVSYETIRQWCQAFGPDYARRHCQVELCWTRSAPASASLPCWFLGTRRQTPLRERLGA